MEPIGAAASPRRAVTIMLAAIAILATAAAVTWWGVSRSAAPVTPAASAEFGALELGLLRVRAMISPIAAEFTSEPATGPIDVDAYRFRVAEARRSVDEINGLLITDPDALRIRDLIVTGGSEVLSGMDVALDAAGSDDASATEPAASLVDFGLTKLQEARDLLDSLLVDPSVTSRSGTGVLRTAGA